MRYPRGRGKCKCAPLKYAEECRTISCAAERVRSVASGAITSRDLVLELPSSPPCLLFSLSIPPFLPFLPPVLIFRQRQSSNNPPRQKPPPTHTHTSRLFSQRRRAIWNFNLRACAHLYMYTGWARRLGPSRAAATHVEQRDDSCLFARCRLCVRPPFGLPVCLMAAPPLPPHIRNVPGLTRRREEKEGEKMMC